VRITCVGGGPVGLYFALLMKLRDPRHDVTVLERYAAGTDHGWGVTLGQDLLDRLREHDLPSAQALQDAGVKWTRQAVQVDGERTVFGGYHIYSFARQTIVDILARRAQEAGVRISYGEEVTGAGELPAADLVVAADGAHSRLRSDIGTFGTTVHLGSNRYIWLGSTAPLEDFSYLFVPTGHGWIWAYAYQHSAQTSTVIVECAADTWAALHLDTLPADAAAALLSDLFAGQLSGHRLIERLPDGSTASWVQFPTVRNERWHSGNIVLAGDSAHTAHFSLGQGTKMGLEDAIVLADAVQRHVSLEGALTAYETQRKSEIIRPLSEARCSAEWFENVPRYIGLKPHQFARLQQSRWSPLIRVLPPRASYQLRQAKERFGLLHHIADRVGPAAKVAYGRRKTRPPGNRRAGQSA
jgi:2-polyprenyl-6-methoxyphenol hydroxylase-like FAD-dependent oxidoreductase